MRAYYWGGEIQRKNSPNFVFLLPNYVLVTNPYKDPSPLIRILSQMTNFGIFRLRFHLNGNIFQVLHVKHGNESILACKP